MTQAELLTEWAAECQEQGRDFNSAEMNAIFRGFQRTIHRALEKGEDVSLTGVGKLAVVKRKARNGINPQTGKKIKIKARNAPVFRPAKALRDLVAA